MDELFKRNLLNLRNPPVPQTFSQALLQGSVWAHSVNRVPLKVVEVPGPQFSEKKQVIESLERFAQEKVQETNSPIIRIDGGGELALKKIPDWDDVTPSANFEELTSKLSLPFEALKILLGGKDAAKVRVIFVTEKFRDWTESSAELKAGFISELILGFPLKTAELFEKMIGAMKLTPDEVVLYPVEQDDTELTKEVLELAAHFRPEVLITLGARATNLILKGNDRLSLIHGQFFQRSLPQVGEFQVVPLFHPSIIETNQNMKKTAWADMQKIMKLLKKLP